MSAQLQRTVVLIATATFALCCTSAAAQTAAPPPANWRYAAPNPRYAPVSPAAPNPRYAPVPPAAQNPRYAPVTSAATDQKLSELVRQAILDNLPREFTGDSDWGHKKEVASGLKFDNDGGRLRISKRTKEVNDGQWVQYHVTLVDPDRHFRVAVTAPRRTAPGHLGFVVYLSAKLDGEVRYERWRRGIKMLNFKVDAGSTVEAAIDCDVGFHVEPGKWFGDLVIEPRVSSVKLAMADIDLERISRIDGKLAEEIGDRLRHSFDKELRSRQDEVAQKLNAAITAHPEKLRFSADRVLLAGWGKTQNALAALADSGPQAAPVAAAAPAPPAADATPPADAAPLRPLAPREAPETPPAPLQPSIGQSVIPLPPPPSAEINLPPPPQQ